MSSGGGFMAKMSSYQMTQSMEFSVDEFIQPPTLFEKLVSCGLYAGAVFQLVCIGAAVWAAGIPSSHDAGNSDEVNSHTDGSQVSVQQTNGRGLHHRRRGVDRKKRR